MTPCGSIQSLCTNRWEPILYGLTVLIIFRSRLCGGQLTITRAASNALQQPPMIIINIGESGLRGRNIGDLNGTIEVCDYHYFIGGLTFAAENHFTGRILLSNQGRTLFYCNAQGIRVLGENEEDLDYLNSFLSLVFLFRIM